MRGAVLRVAAALVAALAAGCESSPPPAAPAPRPSVGSAEAPAPAPDVPLDDERPEPSAAPVGPEVTIKLLADASKKAHVFWGRKDLGQAPLEIHRPRGSGPLDLLVLAPGFLPLHTRVFTDRDDLLSVRLYDAASAAGLLGYPVEIEKP